MALAREVLSSYLHFRDVPETPGGGVFECLGWTVDISRLAEQGPGEEFEGPRPTKAGLVPGRHSFESHLGGRIDPS